MSEDQDRRSHPRFDVVLVATIEPPGGSPLRGRVSNISMSGVQIITDVSIDPGTEVTFQLRLVRGWTENDFLRVPGKVVRASPIGSAHEIAGEFAPDIEDHSKHLLETLVRMLAAQIELRNVVAGGE